MPLLLHAGQGAFRQRKKLKEEEDPLDPEEEERDIAKSPLLSRI